eukprot:6338239-Lingulodinium_polyedra.AAC.1
MQEVARWAFEEGQEEAAVVQEFQDPSSAMFTGFGQSKVIERSPEVEGQGEQGRQVPQAGGRQAMGHPEGHG